MEEKMDGQTAYKWDYLKSETGIQNLQDFIYALNNNRVEQAEKWLQTVVDIQYGFPEFNKEWNAWVEAREKDIKRAKEMLN